METKAVLDRIEDQKFAVLLVGEKEEEMIIPKEQLPTGSKEGMWFSISIVDDQIEQIRIDEQVTEARKDAISQKMALLKKRKTSKFKRD
ncbi:DUF3006 domain-containing protein [Alkalihalobacillus pseudalcaliphilus]|uniref:DUF3006 domain-containing protein n=1 Tax=Alkalihalobacillus pseudalcaliphilus TaxID=79884 RepID=UPI00064DA78E|nr:DUF3006 domain-containing protein [Alkalihalobacillus pseudalcaliphilus]KMK77990.1 hypothetical protein AB990_00605 [Alkalihalobacillus pseudalcaliphilus]